MHACFLKPHSLDTPLCRHFSTGGSGDSHTKVMGVPKRYHNSVFVGMVQTILFFTPKRIDLLPLKVKK